MKSVDVISVSVPIQACYPHHRQVKNSSGTIPSQLYPGDKPNQVLDSTDAFLNLVDKIKPVIL